MVRIPDLRRAVLGISQSEVVIPALRSALNDPKFPSFTIKVKGYDEVYKSSGRWSPSSHGTWNVRQLALYRMAPELMVRAPLDFNGTLSVTQGNFWHGFIAHVLTEQGILIDDEVRFIDEEHQRSGFADGIIKVGDTKQIYELKTINSNALKKLNSVEDVKTLKFPYWCQVQEYLDVFSLSYGRIVFIAPDYPFPMKEFIIEADKVHQQDRRLVYKKALEVANTAKLPLSKTSLPCCGKPDYCAARRGCYDV